MSSVDSLAQAPDEFTELASGVRICWRACGPADGPVLVLVAGLALQLVSWPEGLVRGLVRAGLRVVALDNRDCGRSSQIALQPPGRMRQLLGLASEHNYALEDMADDVAVLLEHLGVRRAHVLGMSMGGMIAQCLAARHASRVRSLCSVFSTTGRRLVGQPSPSTLPYLLRPVPTSVEQSVQQYVSLMRHIGNPHEPGAEQEWADYARRAWVRAGHRVHAAGTARQIGAIQKSGDRTRQLHEVRAPTLVLHGDHDAMVHPSGGRATAQAIAGARLVILPGLAHQIVEARVPELLGHVVPHLAAAP